MNRTTTFKSRSEEETRSAGFEIAKTLAPGDVVGLSGEFGAGKTRLIKEFIKDTRLLTAGIRF